jgi:hypothetical protein
MYDKHVDGARNLLLLGGLGSLHQCERHAGSRDARAAASSLAASAMVYRQPPKWPSGGADTRWDAGMRGRGEGAIRCTTGNHGPIFSTG